MTKVIESVNTFFKYCSNCSMFYRYQEYEDGVHNFDDLLLLGLDLCIYLRASLMHHIPTYTFIDVMSQVLDVKVDHQKCLQAYLHFDAMSKHEYTFNCVECGYHPSILIMDVNKKVAFKNNPSSDVSETEFPETVDCERFWKEVELKMLSRGLAGRKIKSYDIKPDMRYWSPFIDYKTRASNLLLNTEYKKVNSITNDLTVDCRDITEERLMDMIAKKKAKDVRLTAKSIGIDSKGSINDIISRIRTEIGTNTNSFNKIFKRYWGCSGGWLTGSCPHGVVYFLKFILRAEGVRDYLDLLLSMKHRPNIIISDLAHIIASHANGNKQKEFIAKHSNGSAHENFFHPFEGQAGDATDPNNIADAKRGMFEVSLPRINKIAAPLEGFTPTNKHPVTGSDNYLSLLDRFHEKNTNRAEEILRRVGCVKELRSKINTQVEEQLHSIFVKDRHFLNMMTPVNHIFLMRSNLDLYNISKNNMVVARLKSSCNRPLSYDRLGRILYGK